MTATKSEYDYIIVGGGTSGLVVGSRLSEDPNKSVLILEAGSNMAADPRITMPAGWVGLLNSDADWKFKTTAQSNMNNRSIELPQGKAVGGSSAVNSGTFLVPSKAVFDAWAGLGNSNWSWDAISPYFAKFSTINVPKGGDLNLDDNYATIPTGKGPIQVSYADVTNNPLPRMWLDTFNSLGWGFRGDILSGKAFGVFANGGVIDPERRQRSYAINYYNLAAERPNLTLITEAYVNKVHLESGDSEAIASAVEVTIGGETHTIKAKREVILASGAIQTPKLLELSGIGNPEILTKAGIPVVVKSDGVGENLQDHILVGMSLEAAPGIPTADNLSRQQPEALQAAMTEYMTSQSGPFSQQGMGSVAFLPVPESKAQGEGQSLKSVLQQSASAGDEVPQHKYVRELLQNSEEASGLHFLFPAQGNWGASGAQEFLVPKLEGNYFTPTVVLAHPFSRGSTHIQSKDPLEYPNIDPRYLSHPLDLEIIARHVQYLEETVVKTAPISALFHPTGSHHPLYKKYSPFSNLENVKAYAKEVAMTEWHPCGTAAMLPHNKGGVVDQDLRVYGTKNLRIVDASIFPMIPSTNLVSSVYAVAEKAADVIKATSS